MVANGEIEILIKRKGYLWNKKFNSIEKLLEREKL